MGRASSLQYGLVDATSSEELEKMIKAVESRWNELEKPYHSPPIFHKWFVKHCQDVVYKCMVQEIRQKAGLGCPPEPYYTNEVESKNKVIKEEVQYKRSQLPEFVEKMKGIMHEQKQEIERAVLNSGEYRLCEEQKQLGVSSSEWFQMTTDQRRRKITSFMKAKIKCHSTPVSTSLTCPLDVLALPKQLKEALWTKASELAEDDSSITPAPGNEEAWMVKSYSTKRPHYVRSGKNGGYLCDDQCLSYKSTKICSHTVALAMKFDCVDQLVKWYRSLKQKQNFTTLCEAGKPTTSGKKPKRKGVTKKTAATVRKTISRAEESGLEWHNRCEQDSESPESSSHEDYYSSIDTNTTSDPTSSSFSFVSNANVHIGSIATGPTYKNPPPLIPAVAADSFQTPASHETTLPFPGGAQRNDVETPFWLTFIFGNVSSLFLVCLP